ncbi:hypothetical protein niasHT_000707 [Heterodera trifolii]|uniref:Uncharacterized protein n=1 Tax=Heterodera trifolii TaxID=157864 RepID=A0ABD2MBY1_9BILA
MLRSGKSGEPRRVSRQCETGMRQFANCERRRDENGGRPQTKKTDGCSKKRQKTPPRGGRVVAEDEKDGWIMPNGDTLLAVVLLVTTRHPRKCDERSREKHGQLMGDEKAAAATTAKRRAVANFHCAAEQHITTERRTDDLW